MDTAAHIKAPVSVSNYTECMFLFWPTPVHQNLSELTLQGFLDATAYMLIDIALYEFIYAQSPHSMKGLLIGLSFAIQGLFQAIGAVLAYPFMLFISSSLPSCGMSYYIMTLIVGLFGLLAYTYTARCYKYRERDDVCRYAEEYYSKTQEEDNF